MHVIDNIMNSRGPSKEPCGTPCEIELAVDFFSLKIRQTNFYMIGMSETLV